MGLEAGTPIRDIAVDTVFIGSCTNSRIEDLRAAAAVMKGRTVTVPRVMVVPGQPRREGAGRGRGPRTRCSAPPAPTGASRAASMCLAMNPDKLAPGERSASTSNRNFEGRQGRGGRTHLVSPAVAAATAVAGHFATPDDLGGTVMKAVHVISGHAACRCKRSDVDTDQIIPAEWLKRVERTGLREGPVLDVARRPQLRAQRRALRRRDRSSSPARRSASARHASTPCGRSSSTASTP